jgi:hypothetical protein
VTYPSSNGGHPLADLDPEPWELDALAGVMAELDAEGWPEDGPTEDDGPWDDEAQLANAYGTDEDQLAAIGGMIDLAHLTEQQRLAEDELELPARAEDRTAWLLDRVARHTYTEHPVFRDPTDLANGEPGYGCGIYDEHGRCAARFHLSTCLETVRGSAASGSHEAASRWKDTLLANTATAVELATAHRYTEGVDDWLADPGPADVGTLAEMRKILGIGGRAGAPQPMRPAVQITPQELGVY